MIKSRTILYALFVSLFIYIITGTYFMLRFYHNQNIIKSKISSDLKNNCLSALAYYLANPTSIHTDLPSPIKPYKNSDETVLTHKKTWGAYEIFIAQSEKGIYRKKSAFFLGSLKETHGAVYVFDDNKYVSVKGYTILKGDIYVPGAFLKREIFTGIITPSDTIRHSTKRLPEVMAGFKKMVESLPEIGHNKPFENVIDCGAEIPENSTVSFLDSTHVYYNPGKINLSDVFLDGNIIIRSGKSITIDASASLNNLILSAPEIYVLKGFKGSIQLYPDSIIVIQSECNLIYPSFIGIAHIGQSKITIEKDAVVAGGIVQISESRKANEESAICIETGAKVYGLVYTNKSVELGGDIFGSLICMFVKSSDKLRPEKDVFFNCQVNPTALKDEFLYPVVFENSGREIIFEETKNEIKSRNIN